MSKMTRVKLPDEQYDRLETIRDKHGVSWRGMLIAGAKRLESMSPLPDIDADGDG